MRSIHVDDIVKNVKEMCIEANHYLTKDVENALVIAQRNEKSSVGKQILDQLKENLDIAGEDMIPICQDTGMAVIFMEVGQEVQIKVGLLSDAIN